MNCSDLYVPDRVQLEQCKTYLLTFDPEHLIHRFVTVLVELMLSDLTVESWMALEAWLEQSPVDVERSLYTTLPDLLNQIDPDKPVITRAHLTQVNSIRLELIQLSEFHGAFMVNDLYDYLNLSDHILVLCFFDSNLFVQQVVRQYARSPKVYFRLWLRQVWEWCSWVAEVLLGKANVRYVPVAYDHYAFSWILCLVNNLGELPLLVPKELQQYVITHVVTPVATTYTNISSLPIRLVIPEPELSSTLTDRGVKLVDAKQRIFSEQGTRNRQLVWYQIRDSQLMWQHEQLF